MWLVSTMRVIYFFILIARLAYYSTVNQWLHLQLHCYMEIVLLECSSSGCMFLCIFKADDTMMSFSWIFGIFSLWHSDCKMVLVV